MKAFINWITGTNRFVGPRVVFLQVLVSNTADNPLKILDTAGLEM